jgi:integrase
MHITVALQPLATTNWLPIPSSLLFCSICEQETKMPAVTLCVRANTDKGRRYISLTFNRPGKVEPHPEGEYNLRYTDPTTNKRRWDAVGTDLKLALDAQSDRKRLLRNRADDVDGSAAPLPPVNGRYKVEDEVHIYLRHFVDKPKTYKAYSLALSQFRDFCKKIYMDEVTVPDLRGFDTQRKTHGDEDRTRSNKVWNVVTFLRNKEGRRNGPAITNLTITVKYTEPEVIAYSDAELNELFRISASEQKLVWAAFLETGYREQEMSIYEFNDLDGERELVQVKKKRVYDFEPKDKEERTIPVSREFIQAMRARQQVVKSKLVFPNGRGEPQGHFLRSLKQLAHKHGLNCGHCIGIRNGKEVSCTDAPVCQKWILHRFRKTAATTWLRNGASIAEIQKWLGHSDIQTTMRYLAAETLSDPKIKRIIRASS